MKRQKRKKGSLVEPELYVCKWYRTAGLPETDISGPKYIHREWETVARVNHPNIVRYEDFAYDPGKAQLARLYMEYCPCGDLSQFMQPKHGQVDPQLSYHEGIQVLNQLAQALLYLHHGIFKFEEQLKLAMPIFKESESADAQYTWKAILHRDIKPANGWCPHRSGLLKLC